MTIRQFPLWAVVTLTALLGACSTLEVSGAGTETVVVDATGTAQPYATPLIDQAKDDLALAKNHFRAQNYGLAEMHFRRAVESSRGNAEAWIGLAASYDQLRRFDLADRAYAEAFRITGPTPEFLNNRGYSYMLRGDIRRASRDLSEAAAKAPDDERIQNNLRTLDQRARKKV